MITKCPDEFNPDVDWIMFLFHLHNSTVDLDDHVVIHFLRQLRV
jgi:hypothetical protein